jgi:hypothetical protein
MRGFHDVLKEKPSSLLKLLELSSISIISLMIWSINLNFFGQDADVLQLDAMAVMTLSHMN